MTAASVCKSSFESSHVACSSLFTLFLDSGRFSLFFAGQNRQEENTPSVSFSLLTKTIAAAAKLGGVASFSVLMRLTRCSRKRSLFLALQCDALKALLPPQLYCFCALVYVMSFVLVHSLILLLCSCHSRPMVRQEAPLWWTSKSLSASTGS